MHSALRHSAQHILLYPALSVPQADVHQATHAPPRAPAVDRDPVWLTLPLTLCRAPANELQHMVPPHRSSGVLVHPCRVVVEVRGHHEVAA